MGRLWWLWIGTEWYFSLLFSALSDSEKDASFLEVTSSLLSCNLIAYLKAPLPKKSLRAHTVKVLLNSSSTLSLDSDSAAESQRSALHG